MVRCLVIIFTLLSICNGDYLYMSCHSNPNIIAYNVSNGELYTSELIDISNINWLSSSDDLHFRGLAIEENILYVANSKKSTSFIGKWQCNQNDKFIYQSNYSANSTDSADSGLPFIGNFTGVKWYI